MRETILSVDDEEASRYLVGSILRRAGFDVWEACNGGEALRLAQQQPDLILLDVNLPDINGFEVCRTLKRDPATASIPVLHISASNIDSSSTIQGLEGGADGYLTHPVDSGVLVASIKSLLRARQAELQWQTTFDSIHDGICLLDPAQNILKSNKAFQDILQMSPQELFGRNAITLLGIHSKHFEGGSENFDFELNHGWYHCSFHNITGGRPGLKGRVLILTDSTERKKAEATITLALKEKEMLLQEIHHRVKNNLEVIRSLIRLETRKTDQYEVLRILEGMDRRITAMALIHSNLYESSSGGQLDLSSYLRQLTETIFRSYNLSPEIQLNYSAQDISVDLNRAMPLGLILNELLTNSLKYAFDPGKGGSISVLLNKTADEKNELIVRDDGKGLPESIDTTRTLGWKLINLLIDQLNGKLEVERDRPGTNIKIHF